MLHQNGVATKELISSRFFEPAILAKPKAILECYEDIPCNPCETSCPFKAITIGTNINAQPVLDAQACTGCGICVAACPGLAIVVAQLKQDKAIFTIPYEYSPTPKVDEVWPAVNRAGEIICDAKILQVIASKKQNKTSLIKVEVDAQYLHEFVSVIPYE